MFKQEKHKQLHTRMAKYSTTNKNVQGFLKRRYKKLKLTKNEIKVFTHRKSRNH